MLPLPVAPRLLAVYAGFWIGMSLLWAPFLAARSVRRLVGRGPTSSTAVNYLLGMGGATLLNALGVVAALGVAGRVHLLAFFEIAVGVTGGFAALAWLVPAAFRRRSGSREPAGGYGGRLVLACGAAWYVLCAAAVATLLSFVGFLLAFPG